MHYRDKTEHQRGAARSWMKREPLLRFNQTLREDQGSLMSYWSTLYPKGNAEPDRTARDSLRFRYLYKNACDLPKMSRVACATVYNLAYEHSTQVCCRNVLNGLSQNQFLAQSGIEDTHRCLYRQ